MKAINRNILLDLKKDIIGILEGNHIVGHDWVRVCFSPTKNGILVNIYGNNGYTAKEADALAKKFYNRFKREEKVFDKYSKIFKVKLHESSFSCGGEGEYAQDYSIDIDMHFVFNDSMLIFSKDFTKNYAISCWNLSNYISYLVGRNVSCVIKDMGSVCTIGDGKSDYFKYFYELGRCEQIGRLAVSNDELSSISTFIQGILLELGKIDAPISGLRASKYVGDTLYLYKVGEEYIFWHDLGMLYSRSYFSETEVKGGYVEEDEFYL